MPCAAFWPTKGHPPHALRRILDLNLSSSPRAPHFRLKCVLLLDTPPIGAWRRWACAVYDQGERCCAGAPTSRAPGRPERPAGSRPDERAPRELRQLLARARPSGASLPPPLFLLKVGPKGGVVGINPPDILFLLPPPLFLLPPPFFLSTSFLRVSATCLLESFGNLSP